MEMYSTARRPQPNEYDDEDNDGVLIIFIFESI